MSVTIGDRRWRRRRLAKGSPHNEHVKTFYKWVIATELEEIAALEHQHEHLFWRPADVWYQLVDECLVALRGLELEEPLP